MSKQSSVEWLAEEFANHIEEVYGMKITNLNLLVKAKAMHKAEIIDAYNNVNRQEFYDATETIAEQYYNETYGGNK